MTDTGLLIVQAKAPIAPTATQKDASVGYLAQNECKTSGFNVHLGSLVLVNPVASSLLLLTPFGAASFSCCED